MDVQAFRSAGEWLWRWFPAVPLLLAGFLIVLIGLAVGFWLDQVVDRIAGRVRKVQCR